MTNEVEILANIRGYNEKGTFVTSDTDDLDINLSAGKIHTIVNTRQLPMGKPLPSSLKHVNTEHYHARERVHKK